MGKTVYKIIRFILMLPINIIKYFCLGLYFVSSVFIEIMLNAIYFASFLVYKTVKYFVLFFTFPILIFNMFKQLLKRENKMAKTKKNIIEPIVLAEADEDNIEPIIIEDDNAALELVPNVQVDEVLDNNLFDEVPIVLEEPDLDEVNIIDESNDLNETNFIEETYGLNQEIEEEKLNSNLSETETFAEPIVNNNPKKIKQPRKKINIFKYLFLPFEIISYPVYKLFKYIYMGIIFASSGLYKIFKCILYSLKYILNLISKAFVFLSFFVYKIFKYLIYSLGFPILIANIIIIKNKENIIKKQKIREENRLRKEEAKFKKQLAIQKKQEEKLRAEIKRKKQQDEYINENVKIEKKTFKQKFDDLLNILFSSPKVLVDKIKSSIDNSIFMKNKRNKRDINRQALLIDFEGEDAEKSDVKLVYQYTAKNKDGKIITDYMEAFSKVEVHSFLLSEGFEVYNIKTNKWIQFLYQGYSDSKVKIKTKDLIFFLTQLSTYIKAGIPLVDSLKILARQYSKNKKYQRLFRTIIYDLSMGDNFSTALSKRGDAFPRILISMIRASEMTGDLPEVLDDMADYFTEMDKTRKQMITALMYPLIILVVSIGVVVFILLFVIPKFVDIYQSMDASKIPAFTLAVLAVSDFLKNYSIHLLIGILIFIILFIYLFKNIKGFKTLCQWVMMHIPVIKNVIIYNEVTNFTKTFASLLSHNVYITDSMEILTKITNNEIYKMLILDTITNLAKGEKISTSFKDHWAFPIPAYEMLVTGEQTGQLPEMMAKVSDYYQTLHQNSVTRIKTFVEPILIIFLTVVVGIIVLSIIIPMFGMYQTVQGIG